MRICGAHMLRLLCACCAWRDIVRCRVASPSAASVKAREACGEAKVVAIEACFLGDRCKPSDCVPKFSLEGTSLSLLWKSLPYFLISAQSCNMVCKVPSSW